MRRTGTNTALMPVSALLLASLMIASLVGIQGAVDRALNFTIAGRALPALGLGSSSMSPILAPRLAAQRAFESITPPQQGELVRQTAGPEPPAVTAASVPTETETLAPLVPSFDDSNSVPSDSKSKAQAFFRTTLFGGKKLDWHLRSQSNYKAKGPNNKHGSAQPGRAPTSSESKTEANPPQRKKERN